MLRHSLAFRGTCSNVCTHVTLSMLQQRWTGLCKCPIDIYLAAHWQGRLLRML